MLSLAAALILVAGAAAKSEITRLEVCGSSECRIVTDRRAVRAFMSAIVNRAQGQAAPAAREYFTIRPDPTPEWRVTWPRYVYVPAARMIRLQRDRRDSPEWGWLGRRDPLVRRMTRAMTPYRQQEPWRPAGIAR